MEFSVLTEGYGDVLQDHAIFQTLNIKFRKERFFFSFTCSNLGKIDFSFTCSEIARKRQEASLAVSFRNSPKLPKYSSIDVSLRDFWPQYFFHPLFILQGRRRQKEQKCGKREVAERREE